jgi:hypothetical protein
MPLPERREDESRENFMSRCMSDNKVSKEFPDGKQRTAVCMSKALDGLSASASVDMQYSIETFGYTEEINEDNFYSPAEAEYVDFEENTEDWDISVAKPGLWENIRKKKEREGDDYKPARTEKEGRPSPEELKKAQGPKGHPKKSKAEAVYKYMNPKTGEMFTFNRKGDYKKDGVLLLYKGKSAEYQGRKVTLNKPFRTPDGPKKFAVYTKNGSGKVVIVRFGDPNMEIKKDNPQRRKSFRARHKCDTAPGPKWKARYWSCRMW